MVFLLNVQRIFGFTNKFFMKKKALYFSLPTLKLNPNIWDVIMLLVFLALIVIIASATKQFNLPFHLNHPLTISLSPKCLPGYALQTVLRLFLGLIFSLLFTFIFATWAAHNPVAEKIIIPFIDVLQSVPVLSFLSLTIVSFIKLFPNSLLGPECASIFLVFTAQAWNMTLSFYQSLKTVPRDYMEAAEMFGLSSWQRFWRVEVPFAIPALLWNMMMSMSASWFSLVAAEAFSVSGYTILLPGIGSYIALAIKTANSIAILYAIVAMCLTILIYDQLTFRPLMKWAEKFKIEQENSEKMSHAWLIHFWLRTRLLQAVGHLINKQLDKILNARIFRRRKYSPNANNKNYETQIMFIASIFFIIAFIVAAYTLVDFIAHQLQLSEVLFVLKLASYTGLRVLATFIISSIIWVPIGVWIGLRPKMAVIVQPLAQFLAAFPANLLFPIFIVLIVRWQLDVNIWTTPLMILGTQWYVLLNVIAGAAAIPKDLMQVAQNFGVKKWLWWRRLILPAIFPYYITGAITAVGGAWNASIVAEVVVWGKTTLSAKGLGAYITQNVGDFSHTVLGVSMMCFLVFMLNNILWRPLYQLAIRRFQIS